MDIEYALEFDTSGDSINARPKNTNESSDAAAFCQSLETLTK